MNKSYRSASEVHIAGRRSRRMATKKRKPHSACVPALVQIVANEFVWLTPLDILEFVEYLDDSVSEIAVKVAIYNLLKAGKLEKRRYSLGGRMNGVQVKKPLPSCILAALSLSVIFFSAS